MNSFILRHVARGVLPVAVLFAIYLLLRGHDAPGGGFVAGLVTSAAVILDALASAGPLSARRPSHIQRAVWAGLLVATTAGLVSTAAGEGFLHHYHVDIATLHLSTTLLFDIGVYLVVVGSTVTVLGAFAREEG